MAKLLIVDDDLDLIDMLSNYLKDMKYIQHMMEKKH